MCGLCPLADFRSQGNNFTSATVPTPSTAQTTTPVPPPVVTTTTQTPNVPPSAVNVIQPIRVNITNGVSLNETDTASNSTTEKAIDIKIEQKNGKTFISIPNKKVGDSSGSVRVAQQPSSGLYSTLVLILQLV